MAGDAEKLAEENRTLRWKVDQMKLAMTKLAPFIKVEDEVVQQAMGTVLKFGWDALQFQQGYTLLHYAADCCSNPSIIEMLYCFSTNPHQPDEQGMSPVDYAKRAGKTDVIETLESLAAGQNVENPPKVPDEKSPLTGPDDPVAQLQRACDMVKKVGWEQIHWPGGCSPLHVAAYLGDDKVVKELLAASATTGLSAKDAEGRTPLDCAKSANHEGELLQILTAAGMHDEKLNPALSGAQEVLKGSSKGKGKFTGKAAEVRARHANSGLKEASAEEEAPETAAPAGKAGKGKGKKGDAAPPEAAAEATPAAASEGGKAKGKTKKGAPVSEEEPAAAAAAPAKGKGKAGKKGPPADAEAAAPEAAATEDDDDDEEEAGPAKGKGKGGKKGPPTAVAEEAPAAVADAPTEAPPAEAPAPPEGGKGKGKMKKGAPAPEEAPPAAADAAAPAAGDADAAPAEAATSKGKGKGKKGAPAPAEEAPAAPAAAEEAAPAADAAPAPAPAKGKGKKGAPAAAAPEEPAAAAAEAPAAAAEAAPAAPSAKGKGKKGAPPAAAEAAPAAEAAAGGDGAAAPAAAAPAKGKGKKGAPAMAAGAAPPEAAPAEGAAPAAPAKGKGKKGAAAPAAGAAGPPAGGKAGKAGGKGGGAPPKAMPKGKAKAGACLKPRTQLVKPTKQLKQIGWLLQSKPCRWGTKNLQRGTIWEKVADESINLPLEYIESMWEMRKVEKPKVKEEGPPKPVGVTLIEFSRLPPDKRDDKQAQNSEKIGFLKLCKTLEQLQEKKTKPKEDKAEDDSDDDLNGGQSDGEKEEEKAPLDMDNIIKAFSGFDEKRVPLEVLHEVNEKFIITEAEKAEILAEMQKWPEAKISMPVQWMLKFYEIPNIGDMLTCWEFFQVNGTDLNSALAGLEGTIEACDSIINSKILPQFFGFILAFGNFLNCGHAQWGAQDAFEADFALPNLNTYKDTSSETPQQMPRTILHSFALFDPVGVRKLCEDLTPVFKQLKRQPTEAKKEDQKALKNNLEDIDKALEGMEADMIAGEERVKTIAEKLPDGDAMKRRIQDMSSNFRGKYEKAKQMSQDAKDKLLETLRYLNCPPNRGAETPQQRVFWTFDNFFFPNDILGAPGSPMKTFINDKQVYMASEVLEGWKLRELKFYDKFSPDHRKKVEERLEAAIKEFGPDALKLNEPPPIEDAPAAGAAGPGGKGLPAKGKGDKGKGKGKKGAAAAPAADGAAAPAADAAEAAPAAPAKGKGKKGK